MAYAVAEGSDLGMQARIDYARIAPGAVEAMRGIESYVHSSGLESALLELVKTRASQINGCAYCLDMHTKDARAAGETEQRLFALPAWHESPFFTERERAALAWTEAVTTLHPDHVSDAAYQQARGQFTEAELVALTMAVIAINSWNRLAISMRSVSGTYQPSKY